MLSNPREAALAVHQKCSRLSYLNRLVLAAILSGLAAVFQSAGAVMPGVGYFISPLATGPIIICFILSVRHGLLSYLVAIFLLLFSYPSELIIFPFTTGFLGVSIGIGCFACKRKWSLHVVACAALSVGIFTVLYVLKFPLLGPVASTIPSLFAIISILLFSAFYSWIWIRVTTILFRRMNHILGE